MFTRFMLDIAGPGTLDEVVGLTVSWQAALISLTVLFLGIPLIEAVVYRLLKWADFKRSFKDAFLVNLITTLIGFALLAVQPSLPRNNVLSEPGSFLLVSFVLSVVIEGFVLLRLKRHSAAHTWLVALAANLVSYAGLYLLTI